MTSSPIGGSPAGLAGCPFCGGTSIELRDNGIGDTYAICYSDEPDEMACGARTSDANRETDAGAIRRWNRRATPDGWVMVPREPTEEMLDAAMEGWRGSVEPPVRLGGPWSAWEAMLGAAPAMCAERNDLPERT